MQDMKHLSAVPPAISLFPSSNEFQKIRYSDSELEEFRILIDQKLAKAREDYEQLKASLDHSDGNDTIDTSPTFKFFEEGANVSRIEDNGHLAQRAMKFIAHLEGAICRIENKTYGICRETGQLIPKERLRAVPHATLCIDAKQEKKSSKNGSRR